MIDVIGVLEKPRKKRLIPFAGEERLKEQNALDVAGFPYRFFFCRLDHLLDYNPKLEVLNNLVASTVFLENHHEKNEEASSRRILQLTGQNRRKQRGVFPVVRSSKLPYDCKPQQQMLQMQRQ
jgi:hypothetical protein